MEIALEQLKLTEDQEDDCEHFFLQPTNSPYNIADKIKLANEALSNDNPDLENRHVKVKFKEDLVDYEPSLTEDDVNSIESDNELINEEFEVYGETEKLYSDHDGTNKDNNIVESSENDNEHDILPNILNLHLYEVADTFNINEDDENNDEQIEEEVDDENDILSTSVSSSEGDAAEENIHDNNDQDQTPEDVNRISKKINTNKKCFKKSPSHGTPKCYVDCKSHCIERLDFGFNLSINKLEIHNKKPPVRCPTLKLYERKCCENYKAKDTSSLPCYSGYRSEYGLTALQIERRQKRKEIIRMKEERRKRLIEEFKERKRQQNEQVFCQWLKDVARRKRQIENKESINILKSKECCFPAVVNLPSRPTESNTTKQRPSTANNFLPSRNIKRKNSKRPHTSPACVYIQLPHRYLKKGIGVGNIFVTSSPENVNSSSNLHFMTIS